MAQLIHSTHYLHPHMSKITVYVTFKRDSAMSMFLWYIIMVGDYWPYVKQFAPQQ